ncbi:MAG TPA: PKD domain-containing protein, partial [Candidatus Kapabacteria bacterium]
PEPEIVKKFELGEKREIGSVVIGSSQKTFSIDTGEYKGITIYANEGAYPEEQKVTLYATPITENTLGEDITPITPLFTYDAGGKFAGANIQITILLPIPDDKFAMGFFYNSETHELEGMPLVAEDKNGIVVALRKPGDFFISTISRSKLGGDQSSNYKPGTDDWEFANEGTVLTPSGQFAGQTLSSLWYYYTKTLKGNHVLWNNYNSSFDTPPVTTYDNVEGLLFASQTELDYQWGNTGKKTIEGISGGNTVFTRNLLQYSILVTKRPQLVALLTTKKEPFPFIVYKIEKDVIFIADPNLPGNGNRTLSERNGNEYSSAISLLAYNNKQNVFLNNCSYLGASALIDFSKISSSADSAVSKSQSLKYVTDVTISTPGYTLEKINGELYTLSDSIKAVPKNATDEIIVFHSGKEIPKSQSGMYPLSKGENVFGFCAKIKGPVPSTSIWKAWTWYKINHDPFVFLLPIIDSGYIGDQLVFKARTLSPSGSNLLYEWDAGDGRGIIKTTSDTLRISYDKIGTFSLSVTATDLKTGTKHTSEKQAAKISLYPFRIYAANTITSSSQLTTITCKPMHSATRHLRYIWSFGDGSGSTSITDSSFIPHSYQKAGSYVVSLKVYSASTNQLFGSSDTTINISNPITVDLDKLKTMKFVKVEFSGMLTTNNATSATLVSIQGGALADDAPNKIVWNVDSFSTKAFSSFIDSSWAYDYTKSSGATIISGQIALDGSKLLFINANYSDSYYDTYPGISLGTSNSQSRNTTQNLEFVDIIPASVANDTIVFMMSGPAVKSLYKNVTSFYKYDNNPARGQPTHTIKEYISTDWESSVTLATIKVTFYK